MGQDEEREGRAEPAAALTAWPWRSALELWSDATIAGVRAEEPDLTARQMAVLLQVYLHEPPHTVRGLAERLSLAKPAITRALDTLSGHGYVRRKRDPQDGRNVLVQRTVAGAVFLRDFADRFAALAAAR